MRMSKGVEWALHTLLNLHMTGGGPVGNAHLAAVHGLSPTYLNKQLQALVKAGLLTSVPGVRGGFQLARALERITLLDVVEAIEGDVRIFQCTEIRCCGRVGEIAPPPTEPCPVKVAMVRAEDAWRQALAAQTLAEVQAELESRPEAAGAVRTALS
ncbi:MULTISPECIES: Rrf2 family transcriptional regulator [Streptomyces]|uniref:Rrf2 family transcriptional regulator n=1 Tax=Streptomyces TaxID=1883 RepID=UPI00240DCDDC|nr:MULTISPECIES: Rrf2 family transcriptional regulator [Streptomyces]WFB88456.1 Rrf2 family transcriptional regulator [Streptomyces olivaceus]WGK50899.1 Rrf2 family transcriptional regulator [Streptomyces sp. B146]